MDLAAAAHITVEHRATRVPPRRRRGPVASDHEANVEANGAGWVCAVGVWDRRRLDSGTF
jgi:hypothetical protein